MSQRLNFVLTQEDILKCKEFMFQQDFLDELEKAFLYCEEVAYQIKLQELSYDYERDMNLAYNSDLKTSLDFIHKHNLVTKEELKVF